LTNALSRSTLHGVIGRGAGGGALPINLALTSSLQYIGSLRWFFHLLGARTTGQTSHVSAAAAAEEEEDRIKAAALTRPPTTIRLLSKTRRRPSPIRPAAPTRPP